MASPASINRPLQSYAGGAIQAYVTSSGVSAGIDAALAVIARLRGRETSLQIAERAEYSWQEDDTHDPFAPGDADRTGG